MNLNGVSAYSQLDAYSAYTKKTSTAEDVSAAKTDDTAVVYEQSDAAKSAATTYTPNTSIVEMLKADAAAQEERLRSFVQETLMGQGNALAASDDIWKFLASGNYTVSAAAKEEAQKAIGEGGYWSVDKTAERILDMAKALTGGDPEKIEAMRSAFEKGFSEATKAWGKELPEISSKTYDKVQDLFDKWAEESGIEK